MTEDEMVGWHHQFNGCELGHTPVGSEGQGSLVHCNSWGHKESDMTWRLNNDNNNIYSACHILDVQRNLSETR